MSGLHKNIPVGAESAHPLGYNQSSDPGAVGAYKPWVDTTTPGSWSMKIRKADNSGWETIAGGGGSVAWGSITSTPTTLSGYGITDAAPIASPTFTGTPTAPTPTVGDDSTKLATTAFVKDAVDAAVTGGGALPTGGTAGQVLTKQSSSDGDADWETPSSGSSAASLPVNGGRRVMRYYYDNQATAWAAQGMAVTNSGHTSASDEDTGVYSTYNHTTNGFVAGRLGTGNFLRIGRNPHIWARKKTPSDITLVRTWLAIAATDPGDINSSTGLALVGLRYTAGTDTNFTAVVCNGSSGITTADTGVAVVASTNYTAKIEITSGVDVKFYINETLVATITTNLPPAATAVTWYDRIQNLASSQTRGITASQYEVSELR